jgi:hypothetical protein
VLTSGIVDMLTPLVGSAVFSTTRAPACRGVGVERAAGPGHGCRPAFWWVGWRTVGP